MVKKSTLKAITFMKDQLIHNGLNIEKIIVFGSQVNGHNRPDSDIDIVLVSDDFKHKDIFSRARLTKDAEISTIRKFLIPLDIMTLTTEELADETSMLSAYAQAGQVVYARSTKDR